jgi:SAM-dependent methyltransferase
MSQYLFDEHYVDMLRSAMRRWETRQYVLQRLDESLRSIEVHENCIIAIISILTDFLRQPVTAADLTERVTAFQRDWRVHLDRKYLNDYEATRWSFMSEYVFKEQRVPVGRCLDVGCGRGCITATVFREKLAGSVVGIDASNFTHEWNERVSESIGLNRQKKAVVEYKTVPVGQIDSWLNQAGQFDLILLFYVLHHSEEYWAGKTLDRLKGQLTEGGRVIVLEDSLEVNPTVDPVSDTFDLTPIWRNWVSPTTLYCLTPAYDAQVILDFIAVQLLAGFSDVRMPCHYKTNNEWRTYFEQIGYEVEHAKYIGFPKGRDIDVPQSVFVLKLPGAAGGTHASESSRSIPLG